MMRQQAKLEKTLILLGGRRLRFLLEEPLRTAYEGLRIIQVDNEIDCSSAIRAASSQMPTSLVAESVLMSKDIGGWAKKKREQFFWLPIVVVNHQAGPVRFRDSLPQLIESVTSVNYPCSQKELVDAIERSFWWSSNHARMVDRLALFDELSERELAIISMATDGVPNKSIAKRLEVSIKTVEKNRRSAYTKLKVTNSAEMAALVTFRRYFNRFVDHARQQSPGASPLSGMKANIRPQTQTPE